MGKKFNLAEYAAPDVSKLNTLDVTPIPIEKLRSNPRNFYSVDWLEEELAESIQMNGLLDPLVVYKIDRLPEPEWRVISGHRRLKAIRTLHDRTPELRKKWSTVPCIVVPRPADQAREDLMLIQANATGRVLTPHETATQAQRLQEALVALKEQGVDLPGRMRDIVAHAMKLSSSKLARIQAINNNLKVPGFKAAYGSGKLGEAAAYELSQLPEKEQFRALDLIIDAAGNYEGVDIATVKKVKRQIQDGESSKQDLSVCAEKLGLRGFDPEHPEPLFRILLRNTSLTLPNMRVIGSRDDGIAALIKANNNSGGCGGDNVHTSWDCSARGVRFGSPVCRTLTWAQVWDLLILDQAEESRPNVGRELKLKDRPASAETQRRETAGWRKLSENEPEEGQLVAVSDLGAAWMADLYVYRGGQFYNPNDRMQRRVQEVDPDDWWAPLPDLPGEV